MTEEATQLTATQPTPGIQLMPGINVVLEDLKKPDPKIKLEAINRLKQDLFTSDQKGVFTMVLKGLVILVIHDTDRDLSQKALDTSLELVNDAWKSSEPDQDIQKKVILEQVVKVLKESEDIHNQIVAIGWIEEKIADIIQVSTKDLKTYRIIADALSTKKMEANGRLEAIKKEEPSAGYLQELAGWEDVLDRTAHTLIRLWEAAFDGLYDGLTSTIKDAGKNENERTSAIRLLADRNMMGSREALRFLVDQWVRWIEAEKEPRLVEFAAEEIRYNAFAVLPLIEKFGFDAQNHPDQDGADHPTSSALRHEDPQNSLRSDRRIAKQLADMSDKTFIDDVDPRRALEYKYILIELKKHAVPVMLRRLQDDLVDVDESIENEIRKHIVRMLAYTGGREAVDTLAGQLVAKEKTRKARQELLDEYYLEPSLSRSKEAAGILNDAVSSSKRTLRILQFLNIFVFLVGLIILTMGLYVSMNSKTDANRVVGVLASLGGFTGMIALLIRDPLDRIQNAMADLVHVETAFTGFIWELNLNGTFIQSAYVKNGKLKDEEIAETAQRIENAMEVSMRQVSLHTEQPEPHVVTRLTSLEPAAGPFPTSLIVHGQYLQGDSRQKLERAGIVAIDHQPIPVKILDWQDHQVKLDLLNLPVAASAAVGSNGDQPQPGRAVKKDTLFISLFVDGMETNALPYHLLET